MLTRNEERREGERIKGDILETLAARRDVYVNRGRRILLERLLTHGMATADDVYRAMELPADIDPRCLGSIPGPLARAGIIRRAGFISSDRRERHASTLSVWELIDEDAARRWLAAHPDTNEGPDVPATSFIPTNETAQALAMPGLLF